MRDASVTQINGNAEINAIKQILGLQHGKVGFTPPSANCLCNMGACCCLGCACVHSKRLCSSGEGEFAVSKTVLC